MSAPKILTELDSSPVFGDDASNPDIVISGAGTAAAKTYAADSTGMHVISQILYSYSTTPTGGRLTVEDGSGNYIVDVDLPAGGPNSINFTPPLEGTINTAMIVTMAAPGGSIVGKLNIRHKVKRYH
jgi:hypothetical protein